jgi:hypothetical protein
MSDYSHTPLKLSIEKLLEDIESQMTGDFDLSHLGALTAAILQQLKAMDTLEARREREAARAAKDSYTRFEDLPPPPPEERARIIALLNRHFGVSHE